MDLAAPIEEVKGIGPKTAEVLHKAGIFTLRDLVYHLPRDYEDFQQAQDIASLKPGKVTVKAKVESITTRRMRRNLALTEATLRDKTGAIKVIWFNQPYRAKQFDQDKEYYFSGTPHLRSCRKPRWKRAACSGNGRAHRDRCISCIACRFLR